VFCPGGKKIMTTSEDKTLKIIEGRKEYEMAVTDLEEDSSAIKILEYAPDHDALLTVAEGSG
jgi:hypothetical protein